MEKTNPNQEDKKIRYAHPDQSFFEAPDKDYEFMEESDIGWESESEKISEPQMIKANVFDAAAYILKRQGEMTTMKLHKLLYYAQAWSLVWDEEPLFNEAIEAWANGPVVRRLFAYHRGHFKIDGMPIGNPDVLSEKQKETINAVLDFYGDKTSQYLIELSHLEDPWKNARIGLSPNERGDRIISNDSMANYYSSL